MSYYTQPADFCIPPDDEPECPDVYLVRAREELRADLVWISEQIADSINSDDADLLTVNPGNDKDLKFCDRLRSVVFSAIEREAPDLAESLWQRDIESSQQDAAEHAAECVNDYY